MNRESHVRLSRRLVSGGLLVATWGALAFLVGPDLDWAVAVLLGLLIAIAVQARRGKRASRRAVAWTVVVATPLVWIPAALMATSRPVDQLWTMLWAATITAVVIAFSVLGFALDRAATEPRTCWLTSTSLMVAASIAVMGAWGATAAVSIAGTPPSCGESVLGVGGNVATSSATAGQCFVAAARHCAPRLLSVYDQGVDTSASQQMRVVPGGGSRCSFRVSIEDHGRFGFGHRTDYSCTTLAPYPARYGPQEVQLTGCDYALQPDWLPVIPVHQFQFSIAKEQSLPRFATFHHPFSILCANSPNNVIAVPFTWSVVNATGVDVAVDDPSGPYESFKPTETRGLPFACPNAGSSHTYYFRTVGGTGPAAQEQAHIVQYFMASAPPATP